LSFALEKYGDSWYQNIHKAAGYMPHPVEHCQILLITYEQEL